ncbi:hypothetical protein ACTFIW_006519 [Dictyostelium discoideum]
MRSNESYSDRLARQGKDVSIKIGLKFGDNTWRDGQFIRAGNDVDLHVVNENEGSDVWLEDNNSFKEFTIYVVNNPARAGGATSAFGQDHTCLYDCLREIYGRDFKIKSDADFKEKIGSGKDIPVSIDLIDKVEDLLKVKIIVTGDYIHNSGYNSNKTIRLKLENGHYTIDKSKKLRCKGISNKERVPLVYIFNDDTKSYDVYGSIGQSVMSVKTFQEEKKNSFSSNYLLLPLKEDGEVIEQSDETLLPGSRTACLCKTLCERTLSKFIKIANSLKEETDGKINLYKYGNEQQAAAHWFNIMLPKDIEADDILPEEAVELDEATCAALIKAVDHYEG